MRILALETSDRAGSIALLEADRVLAERVLASSQRTAQSLAPAAHELIAQLGWQPTDVELVAVASGPGSFTGLRIGITFAKVFAYAVRCQLLGVNTLEAIAARAPGDAARFWAVIDAQRNELFAAEFARDGHGELRFEQETHVVDSDMWLERLSPGSVVTGPALAKLSTKLPDGTTMLPAELWQPTASAVGALAWKSYSAGRRDDPFTLVPDYFRRTAAEEQWEKKGK